MRTSEVTNNTASENNDQPKQGHDATTESPPTTGNKWTSVKRSTSEVTNNTASENNNNQINQAWWRFIVVSAGLAALIISVFTVNIWTRTKGNKTQADENMEHIEEDEDEGTVNYENVRDPSASA